LPPSRTDGALAGKLFYLLRRAHFFARVRLGAPVQAARRRSLHSMQTLQKRGQHPWRGSPQGGRLGRPLSPAVRGCRRLPTARAACAAAPRRTRAQSAPSTEI